MRRHDHIGQRFERLVAIAEAPGKGALYLCRCDCGIEKVIASQNLRAGLTRSCGCLNREVASARMRKYPVRKPARFGPKVKPEPETPEYRTWTRMITRCENVNSVDYAGYGGRGISVAPEWRHDYPAFLAHIGPRPSKAHSIDRIDNSRGYEPGNVRWATPVEQARNTRRNRYITIDGETKILTDWARLSGNSESVIFYRLKRGVAPREAVFAPTKQGKTA